MARSLHAVRERSRGATIWITGLPASGKSTLAFAVEAALLARGRAAYVLDGDNVRTGLCSDLGFGADDRRENVRRVAEVARLFADAGTLAVVALISPDAASRAAARRVHHDAGLPFLEVWMDTPLEVCEGRDPKGLYARARAGTLQGLTGVDAPYDRPDHPDVVLRTVTMTPEEEVAHVLRALDSAEAGAVRPPSAPSLPLPSA
ncbi:MAG: Adenylylsulfate kinase [uncultured Solirubrobacteraceae bacterium]|uniref:Adenylyl-sulfate kinase n=1 Tax=uncultured Solirubrobacteraceae bacterium TaxID=1162706 RepID=A0A6J4SB85_9ACTN|nr:MAG: Adenylylsulfate kinase [uncultured Solirubrobacteraceae bacterium]